MKVAFFNFFPFTLWNPGGGEIQMRKLAEYLGKLGVRVELFDVNKPKIYDIIHLFTSTYQVADFAQAVKGLGMKLVLNSNVSTNKPAWFGKVWSLVDKILPLPTLYTYRKRVYDAADIIIPNSEIERNHIAGAFRVPLGKFRVIKNGVDPAFQSASPEIFEERFHLKGFILRVGSISPVKNQLRIIEAWKILRKPLPIVFIGPPMPNFPDYVKAFVEQVKKEGILWIQYINHDDPLLASAYAASSVHVMASLGESTGLVSLEAGLAGTRLVAVNHPIVKEYLSNNAVYCNPKNPKSIAVAIEKALEKPPPNKEWFKRYTWDKIAREYLSVYREVLGEN